jgi:hypothetical protein
MDTQQRCVFYRSRLLSRGFAHFSLLPAFPFGTTPRRYRCGPIVQADESPYTIDGFIWVAIYFVAHPQDMLFTYCVSLASLLRNRGTN